MFTLIYFKVTSSIYNSNNSIKAQLTSNCSTLKDNLHCLLVRVGADEEGCPVGSAADGCSLDVVGVDGSALVASAAVEPPVIELALVVESVLEDRPGSCREMAETTGATGDTGLGTATAGMERDVVGDVTASVIDGAATDAGPEPSLLPVSVTTPKPGLSEMQRVD
ncbi:hypothetical protein ABVK25_012402 [Lepraria finkii]|uniref:Uncharacterized protein n=1 Tax=Lepraria finkii TaxID=1340010 RepID=A0ABR4AIR5_9LECA